MIHQGVANSYKVEILHGIHRVTDEYKIALYVSAATLSKDTTHYIPQDEVEENGTYEAGGLPLEGVDVRLEGDTVLLTWTRDPIWARTTVQARGALIYNASRENRAVAVLDFGETVHSTNGPFTIEFTDRDAIVELT